MRLSLFSLLGILIALLIPSNLYGQVKSLHFSHYRIEQGLSENFVVNIEQDQWGYLWIATGDGLNKFDGYKFTVYQNDINNPVSLSNNNVTQVYLDSSNQLWVGTQGGLNRYDPQTDSFIRYLSNKNTPNSLSNNEIYSIYQDSYGQLWIGTGEGLNLFDPVKNIFKAYYHDNKSINSLSSNNIKAIYQDRDNRLWIGTDDGLNRYDRERDCFIRYRADEKIPGSLSSNEVQAIYQDRQGVLWIGTYDGLNRYDAKQDRFIVYSYDPDKKNGIGESSITSFCEDNSNQLWIGTSGGISRYNRLQDNFTVYRNDPLISSSLSFNAVWTLFTDQSGVLWIGTNLGLDKVDLSTNKFITYYHDPRSANSLSSSVIFAINEDSTGTLWIGTDDGLNRFDQQKDGFVTYRFSDQKADDNGNAIYALREDRSGQLWVGTGSGAIYRYDRKNDRFIPAFADIDLSKQMSGCSIVSIFEDKTGIMWFGTLGCGLIKYNPIVAKPIFYLRDVKNPGSISNNNIFCIFQDNSGTIYVGTQGGGLNRYNEQTNTFTAYRKDSNQSNSIKSNVVLAIYQDKKERLWIGAHNGGLNLFDPQTEKFTTYTKKDGLVHNSIFGILEDQQGQLWLSTPKGLSRFDPDNIKAINFDTSNGLQSYEFNFGAYHQNHKGEMFFGGINGFNRFYPKQITNNSYLPPIVITSFKLFDRVMPDAIALLAQDMSGQQNRQLILQHNENYLSFEFAALSYSQSDKNQYAYKLEGLDEDWIMAGNRRYTSYTNLKPGEYIFRVKGSNNNGVWNEQGAAMRIKILPPLWLRWWAYAIYFTLFLATLIVANYLRNIRLARQRELMETKLRADAAEFANRAKSAFLANMSHELRTPLNGMLGFTQLILRKDRLNSDDRKHLQTIEQSGRHLLSLINDVLSISKIETGNIALKQQRFNLYNTLNEIVTLFQATIHAKELEFIKQLDPELPLEVMGDEGKLRQVLINLLSNACKFTAHGQITLTVQSQGERILFQVADTGSGIGKDELTNLFKPFYQTASGEQAKEGAGLGLSISRNFVQLMGGDLKVNSEPDKGSRFYFDIYLKPIRTTQSNSQPRQVKGLLAGQPELRILVVDDREENRIVLSEFLSAIGFHTRTANNGEQAIEHWQQWRPHLIFMDMRMKVMDGYTATSKIRQQSRSNLDPIIIAFTASAFDHDLPRIKAVGCNDIVIKPYLESVVLDKLAQHLGVIFQYQDQLVDHQSEKSDPNLQLEAELLQLPIELLKQLYTSLIQGKPLEADQLIDTINNERLVNELRALLRAFQLDRLVILCEQAINIKESML